MWGTAYVSVDWFDRKHFHKWCVSIKCTVSHWLSIARACKELRFLFPLIGLRQFLKWYYHLLVHLGYHMKVSCLEKQCACSVTAARHVWNDYLYFEVYDGNDEEKRVAQLLNDNEIPNDYKVAFRQQTIIGWEYIFTGKFARGWRQCWTEQQQWAIDTMCSLCSRLFVRVLNCAHFEVSTLL